MSRRALRALFLASADLQRAGGWAGREAFEMRSTRMGDVSLALARRLLRQKRVKAVRVGLLEGGSVRRGRGEGGEVRGVGTSGEGRRSQKGSVRRRGQREESRQAQGGPTCSCRSWTEAVGCKGVDEDRQRRGAGREGERQEGGGKRPFSARSTPVCTRRPARRPFREREGATTDPAATRMLWSSSSVLLADMAGAGTGCGVQVVLARWSSGQGRDGSRAGRRRRPCPARQVARPPPTSQPLADSPRCARGRAHLERLQQMPGQAPFLAIDGSTALYCPCGVADERVVVAAREPPASPAVLHLDALPSIQVGHPRPGRLAASLARLHLPPPSAVRCINGRPAARTWTRLCPTCRSSPAFPPPPPFLPLDAGASHTPPLGWCARPARTCPRPAFASILTLVVNLDPRPRLPSRPGDRAPAEVRLPGPSLPLLGWAS